MRAFVRWLIRPLVQYARFGTRYEMQCLRCPLGPFIVITDCFGLIDTAEIVLQEQEDWHAAVCQAYWDHTLNKPLTHTEDSDNGS